jgi:hypothetical protein
MKTKEQIINWMKEKGIWQKVVFNLMVSNPTETLDDIMNNANDSLLFSKFIFSKTEEGSEFWLTINAKFEQWYNEKELPKTWEEFCDNYMIDEQTCWIDDCSDLRKYKDLPDYKTLDVRNDKFTFNNQQTAEAFIALAQLLMLRNEYVGNWKVDWDDKTQIKYCVTDKLMVKLSYSTLYSKHPLSFPTEKLAREFKKNFQDLLNKASMLI